MKRYLFLVALLSISFSAISQKITGVVYDKKTKETLPSANIYWLQGGGGTITDIDGNFTIEKKKSNQTKLIFSYTGYANDTVEIKDKSSLKIYLTQTGTTLSTFEVRERMKSTYISKTSLENKEIVHYC
jgi:iron complex outermembrane receptor protein